MNKKANLIKRNFLYIFKNHQIKFKKNINKKWNIKIIDINREKRSFYSDNSGSFCFSVYLVNEDKENSESRNSKLDSGDSALLSCESKNFFLLQISYLLKKYCNHHII